MPYPDTPEGRKKAAEARARWRERNRKAEAERARRDHERNREARLEGMREYYVETKAEQNRKRGRRMRKSATDKTIRKISKAMKDIDNE